MSICKTKILRSTTISRVEVSKCHQRRGLQIPSNNRRLYRNGTNGQEPDSLPRSSAPEHEASFCSFTDQIVLKERPAIIETAPMAHLTRKLLFERDVEGATPINIKEEARNLVHETLTASREGIDNSPSTAMEKLVIRTVNQVVSSPNFEIRLLNVVIDCPGSVDPLTMLAMLRQQRL